MYDVVLLPPRAVNQKALDVSRQLERLSTEFRLEQGRAYPHLSLYMANFTSSNLKRATELLRSIAADNQAQSLAAVRYAHEVE